jgi:predicted CXXCH cytochrome family protein
MLKRFFILLILLTTPLRAAATAQDAHGPATAGSDPAALTVGSCGNCHDESSTPSNVAAPSQSSLNQDGCEPCHEEPSLGGLFPGRSESQISTHSLDPRAIWPGPKPPAGDPARDQGKCTNCHDPHSEDDRFGTIPSLLVARDQKLCLRCHDGSSSSTDIATEVRKPYAHAPRRGAGLHSASEEGDPSRFAYSGQTRHVSCSDCHNVHAIRGDSSETAAPKAYESNNGVSRVRVQNGGPGSVPAYQFLSALDTAIPVLEYEICFKCHSSWTRLPPGQVDIARRMNPNNASHHAVEAAGNNPRISLQAFTNMVGPETIIRCSDCHASDEGSVGGPHGSSYAGLLRRPYDETDVGDRSLLCYNCHNYDTYASLAGPELGASRFNPPGARAGHALHVGREGLSCRVCHDSHGSADQRALLSSIRGPQLLRFVPTSGGGSCQSGCHDRREYRGNYPW